MRITLDGDSIWDRDGIANGVILDPFSIGSSSIGDIGGVVINIGSGFSGCALSTSNKHNKFDPGLYVLLMLAIFALLRKKLNLL